MKKQDVAILGAAGLTGRELMNLLSRHPRIRISHITSSQHAGVPVSDVFPQLEGRLHLSFAHHEDPLPPDTIVFLATPNDVAMAAVPDLVSKKHRVIDLSGAYRIHDRAIFEEYYRMKHTHFDLMPHVVYGLPEIFRTVIPSASIIANPGCYPTSAVIPLYYLGDLRNDIESIVVDSKSGVSGAGGRTEDAGYSFRSVQENFRAYKILKHQHSPEIQEYAAWDMNMPFPFEVVFTPHLLPLMRGILSTIVIHWKKAPEVDVLEHLQERAVQEYFVRVLDTPEEIELARVQHTNYIDFSARTHGRVTVIVSAIDNLLKGAAGQAIQNMNLMLGYPETMGILD